MLREFAALFRAIVCRPAKAPLAARATRRAVTPARRRAPLFSAAAILLGGAMLFGCGIKGPLRPPPTAASAPAAAPAAPAAAAAPAEAPAAIDPAAKPKP